MEIKINGNILILLAAIVNGFMAIMAFTDLHFYLSNIQIGINYVVLAILFITLYIRDN